ncbi:MAG: hypothetical protein KF819_05105 [Labilithrix sp.]|nr:hypothetical protein [Labilithrix sp.]
MFARHAAPTPYGYASNPHAYGEITVPPSPNSLAPIAMSSERHLASTGSYRGAPTVLVREKPSMKWGVMIALTGAILGGVLGIGMDARRSSRAAAAASQAEQTAPAVAPVPVPVQPSLRIAAPANAVVAPNAPNAIVAPAPVVLPTAQPVVVAPAPVAPAPAAPVADAKDAKESKTAKNEPAKSKHGSKGARPVAHAPAKGVLAMGVKPVAEPKPAPEPVAKSEPAPKPEKKSTKSTDAEKVLADAIKDTTNTL